MVFHVSRDGAGVFRDGTVNTKGVGIVAAVVTRVLANMIFTMQYKPVLVIYMEQFRLPRPT